MFCISKVKNKTRKKNKEKTTDEPSGLCFAGVTNLPMIHLADHVDHRCEHTKIQFKCLQSEHRADKKHRVTTISVDTTMAAARPARNMLRKKTSAKLEAACQSMSKVVQQSLATPHSAKRGARKKANTPIRRL